MQLICNLLLFDIILRGRVLEIPYLATIIFSCYAEINRKSWICWNGTDPGCKCELFPMVTVSNDCCIVCNICRKSWKAVGKVGSTVKINTPLANFCAIVVQSSRKAFLVICHKSVEYKASIRNGEERDKRQKLMEELHGD
jgi:hypothetical protein